MNGLAKCFNCGGDTVHVDDGRPHFCEDCYNTGKAGKKVNFDVK